MSFDFQFALRRARARFLRRVRNGVCVAGVFAVVIACPMMRASQIQLFAAQQTQASAEIIAHIEGGDVSIGGKMLEKTSTLVSVINGNAITVHSGEAYLTLVDGGEISICGPAKLTALESNGTITLALQFGTMHFELPATVKVRVLTPSIVATPIDIAGGKRDLIVGLDQNDSLCVLAATGAVQLEQQFSGERMIVPEAGDFSLQDGQLLPMTDTGQSCKCVSVPLPTATSEPETAMAAANDSHPVVSAKEESAEAPPVYISQPSGVLPSLVFSSPTLQAPNAPTEETAAIVREVRADPDWEFSGRVETPDFAHAMSQALGMDGNSAAGGDSSTRKKSGGFWASLKRFFVG